jgi:hypothetical protein
MTLAASTGFTISIYGNFSNGTGTTLSGTGTFIFSGYAAQTILSNGKSFTQTITVDSKAGTLQLLDAFTSTRNQTGTVGALGLLQGTLDLNGQTLTLAGLSSNVAFLVGAQSVKAKDLTFNGGSLIIATVGTTAFRNNGPSNGFTTTAGSGTGSISMTGTTAKTFVGAGATFNCTLNQGGAGALTITGANTFTDITNTVQPATVTFPSSTTTTVTNFSLTGTAGNLITVNSSSAGAAATLIKASGVVSASYLSIKDSTAAGGATWNALNSTDAGNNTGWIFAAVSATNSFFALFN